MKGKLLNESKLTSTLSSEIIDVDSNEQNISKAINTVKYTHAEGRDGILYSMLKSESDDPYVVLLKLFAISTECYLFTYKNKRRFQA